jgi:hypothetical protein
MCVINFRNCDETLDVPKVPASLRIQ